MSASVGTAQQSLGVGIGKIGTAFFAIALAAVIAAALIIGMPAVAKPAAPAAGLPVPAIVLDRGSRGELSAPVVVPFGTYYDHGSSEVTSTLPDSFGGWNGPRSTAPGAGGTIDGVDHGARDDAGNGASTGGSNGPRLRAQ